MTKWMWKCGLAGSLALASMVGCGDDDKKGDDKDGSDAGTGTDGGQPQQDASTGQDAGTDAGEPVTAAECIANQPEAVADECASCICDANAMVSNDCGTMPACWGLISCVQENCPGLVDDERTACAVANCGAFLGAAGSAMAVGGIIAESCSAECAPPAEEDGGLGDAGEEDAGGEDAAVDEDAGVDAAS